MRPISRRTFLGVGGLGVASLLAGGAESADLFGRLDTVAGGELRQPEELTSSDGVLDVRLEAGLREHRVAGARARTLTYNGGLPGPTLRLRPGDRLRVELANRLEQPTNLHMHGLQVSPSGDADNVFRSIAPGKSAQYQYELGSRHPSGTHWYHPHLHGIVAEQVAGGLYGAIEVRDPSDDLDVDAERLLVVSDIALGGDGELQGEPMAAHMTGREGDHVLVNGQRKPTVTARRGERHRWRVVNACSSRYLDLRADGLALTLLARDGHRLAEAGRTQSVGIVPGGRADLIVDIEENAALLRTAAVRRSAGGMMGAGVNNAADLLSVRADGGGSRTRRALQGVEPAEDLRRRQPSRRRTLVMGTSAGMMGGSFTFDGLTYDSARVDQRVEAGVMEEWTISNSSTMDHPFHLHVWPMQPISENGRRVSAVTRRDVVNVPAGGEVVVRIAFEEHSGRTVYHCHILDHEDRGMMGIVEVGGSTV